MTVPYKHLSQSSLIPPCLDTARRPSISSFVVMSPALRRSSFSDSDSDRLSDCSSASSCDEEEVNCRMAPNWCAYRHVIERRGFRLDTHRDVKQWYQHYWESLIAQGYTVNRDSPGYARACNGHDDELCKDAGLVSAYLCFLCPRQPLTLYSARESLQRDSMSGWNEGRHQSS